MPPPAPLRYAVDHHEVHERTFVLALLLAILVFALSQILYLPSSDLSSFRQKAGIPSSGMAGNYIVMGDLAGAQSVVSRRFWPPIVSPGGLVTVYLDVTVLQQDRAYTVEENVPAGFIVVDPGSGSTMQDGTIKWIDIGLDARPDRTYPFTLRVPAYQGTSTFTGNYLFENTPQNLPQPIAGESLLQLLSGHECDYLTDADLDGWSLTPGCGLIDCDDSDPVRNPGAFEYCDGKDNNCDASIDEGCQISLGPAEFPTGVWAGQLTFVRYPITTEFTGQAQATLGVPTLTNVLRWTILDNGIEKPVVALDGSVSYLFDAALRYSLTALVVGPNLLEMPPQQEQAMYRKEFSISSDNVFPNVSAVIPLNDSFPHWQIWKRDNGEWKDVTQQLSFTISAGEGIVQGISESNITLLVVGSHACQESWRCSPWSQDTCGTRTCSDNNQCGTILYVPAQTLTCPVGSGSGGDGGGGGGGGSGWRNESAANSNREGSEPTVSGDNLPESTQPIKNNQQDPHSQPGNTMQNVESCEDGLQNQDESAVDCEGICGGKWQDGACFSRTTPISERAGRGGGAPEWLSMVVVLIGLAFGILFAFKYRLLDLLYRLHAHHNAGMLRKYVTDCRIKGFSDEQITSALHRGGWHAKAISQHLVGRPNVAGHPVHVRK